MVDPLEVWAWLGIGLVNVLTGVMVGRWWCGLVIHELRLRLGNMEERKNYHKERKEHYAERATFYRSKCEELDRLLSVMEDVEA